eukprot:1749670-Rhodomonas_salina.5
MLVKLVLSLATQEQETVTIIDNEAGCNEVCNKTANADVTDSEAEADQQTSSTKILKVSFCYNMCQVSVNRRSNYLGVVECLGHLTFAGAYKSSQAVDW